MKIRIELEENAQEEIILRCRELTPKIMELQRILSEAANRSGQIILYKDDKEYYLDKSRILFFETENSTVMAHTAKDAFETKFKLYELEELLGSSFLRISKSSIVNISQIYAIRKSLTASSTIEFHGTHKQIYVSRAYYHVLREKLEEKRLEL